jgi:hypothetical protein
MKRNCLISIGMTALMFLSTPVGAWNQAGHRIIAAMAYDQLTDASKVEVARLLSHHPEYMHWIQGVPPAEAAEKAFMDAASWPDDIKSDPSFTNDGEIPTGPLSGQNIGFSDHLMHKYWHYVDFGFSTDGTPVKAVASVNVVTQIELIHKSLSDPKSSDQLKAYDLAWLIHLVADIHQPMHAVSRYTQDAPEGDAGGNRVHLCEHPCRSNLHSLWDDALGHGKQDDTLARKAVRLEGSHGKASSAIDPKAWAVESFQIAQKVAYEQPSIGTSLRAHSKPTERYHQQAHEIAKERARLASIRLAYMINSEVSASKRH